MALNSAYLQNLIDELNLADTNASNIVARLGGEEFGKSSAVLALLLALADAAASGVPVTPPTPVTRTLAGVNKTADYTVPTGARSVLLVFSSDFAGTVLGATITPAQSPSMSFTADQNNLLPAIAITVSAGNVNVFTMV